MGVDASLSKTLVFQSLDSCLDISHLEQEKRFFATSLVLYLLSYAKQILLILSLDYSVRRSTPKVLTAYNPPNRSTDGTEPKRGCQKHIHTPIPRLSFSGNPPL